MQAYRDLGSRNILEEGCNPIKKRPLVVSGHDTEVMMDLLEGELVGDWTSGVDAFVGALLSETKRYVCYHLRLFTCAGS